ncbi:MAG: ADP-ribosylglycohydrolase family protein [Chloroflexota bacterium]|nr:ADP-ribosylglycohydrolase family protein [Chloroflexota bacterium]
MPRAEGALLAAAVGDALGWPQEDRGRRVRAPAEAEPRLEFSSWWRREGGRYAAYEVEIGPGEYSDDTQLMLALAHALRAEDAWWERWTSVELPFWLLYERGGGAATKRAARSWTTGKAPWRQDNPASYFNAGGNGVAMRVLPHCVRGASSDDFSPIASAVTKDGIATHGHPVALVGALAYAYALWKALRRERSLDYGELIADTRASVSTWSRLPEDLPTEWPETAERHIQVGYSRLWGMTVEGMVGLLDALEGAIGQGSLAFDRETLESLGAFDRQIGGAGTVTAAGALYLASRYASRPAQGILAGAFSRGADTDTLASMTGGLLGAISGTDWLGGLAAKVQDYEHLRVTAQDLVAPSDKPTVRPKESTVARFSRRVAQLRAGDEIPLPDGRVGALTRVRDLPTKTRHEIKSFVFSTDDGQTLHVTKRRRTKRPGTDSDQGAEQHRVAETTSHRRKPRVTFAIEATDLERSTRFYRDLIGLEVTRKTTDFVSFGGEIVLFPTSSYEELPARQLDLRADGASTSPTKILIFVEPPELDAVRERIVAADFKVSPVTTMRSLRRFRCSDPDGTTLEIREANGVPR